MSAAIWRVQQILIGLAVVVMPGFAVAEAPFDCASQIMSRRQALLHHVSELNPSLLERGEDTAVEKLFLTLKREEENVRGARQISERLQSDLRGGPLSRRYRLSEMSASELTQFYQNSLYAFYVRTGDLWSQQQLSAILQDFDPLKGEHGRELTRIAKNIFSTFFSPYGLRDQDLSVARAEEYFTERQWLNFPWIHAMALVNDWLRLGKGVDGNHLDEIWQRDADNSPLKREHLDRINRSICDRPQPAGPVCCQSGMACVRCPHNRIWLRDERGSN